MIGLYQHAVQIVSTRIGKVVAAVKREVGFVLTIWKEEELGSGPVVEVFGPGQPDRPVEDAILRNAAADQVELFLGDALDATVGVVVTGLLVVSGGEASIHGKIGENLVGPLPVNAVGGNPPH